MSQKQDNKAVIVVERGNRLVSLLAMLSVILATACALLGAKIAESSHKPSIDETTVTTQLQSCSDLATSKMMYRGLLTYESGSIDLWDKKSFQMIYDADIKAGVDMSKAKVSMDGKKIDIALPAAMIQDVSVDPDSIKIYDQKYSLLNWTDRSDTSTAMSQAKRDARKAAEQTDIAKQADEQARKLVKQMFAVVDGKDGYQINVSTKDTVNDKAATENTDNKNDNDSSKNNNETE